MPRQIVASLLLVVCGLILSGCAAASKDRAEKDSSTLNIPDSWHPELLYLQDSPHDRLYVEIDAVAGCEPKESEVRTLRDFLVTHCTKPGGIEIVRNDVIPLSAAKGISAKALARRYLNGPDTNSISAAAFLYVLFYNDAHSADAAVTKRSKPANPHAEIWPYPTIYFNTRYLPSMLRDEGLVHEAGHILGLARRSSDKSLHCPNDSCLMKSHLRILRVFVGSQKSICADCRAELTARAIQPPLKDIRFSGAVLVRAETHYHVLSLPDRITLIIGGFDEKIVTQFARLVRSGTVENGDQVFFNCTVQEEILADAEKVSQTLASLKADVLPLVNQYGPKILMRASATRYEQLGQYSNSVAMLQQANQPDSEDAEGFNLQAWIQATCPDAAVRNGAAAVAAGRKACELTQWKEAQYIDTLAAAYAETGDFRHAIELQQQALRTGTLSPMDEAAMRERFALYQQKKPYRESPRKR